MKEPDVSIDLTRLHEEWAGQADRFLEWADALAVCRKATRDAKKQVEEVKAALSLSIRLSPSVYGLEKATEDAVKATVLLQDEYKEALEQQHSAQFKEDKAEGRVRAFEHRKAALENEVTLWAKEYFATPTLRDQEVREKAREDHTRKVRGKGRS